MSSAELLQTLVGNDADDVEAYFSPPAPGWRTSPAYLARRELNRLRSVVNRKLEPVAWSASPGRRPRYPLVRQAALGGHVRIDIPDSAPIRIMQKTAGFTPTDKIRVGSGGGIRQLGRWHDRPALARLGTIGSSGDPLRHFQALEQLSLKEIPAGFNTGLVSGVRWTIEECIVGQPLKHVTSHTIELVTTFLAALPGASGRADVIVAASDHLATLSVDVSSMVRTVGLGLEHLPTVTAHGDLWSGNLLFQNQMLAGVIDWDSWQERAVPGTDLIHLWAEDTRRSRGLSYGDLVVAGFWNEDRIVESLATYMAKLNVRWDKTLQPLLGAAWWLTAVSGAVRRNSLLSRDSAWMATNVHRAVEAFDNHLS